MPSLSSDSVPWLNSHARCGPVSGDERLEFPVQFTMPVTRAFSHNAPLCRFYMTALGPALYQSGPQPTALTVRAHRLLAQPLPQIASTTSLLFSLV